MLWRRLWLVFVAYMVVIAAVTAGLGFAGVGAGMTFLIAGLIALLVGFEAANLRRWTLLRGGWRRRGWREVGAVIGDDVETAERRFFDVFVAAEAARKAAPPAPPAPALRPGSAAADVVGLFPQPGANR